MRRTLIIFVISILAIIVLAIIFYDKISLSPNISQQKSVKQVQNFLSHYQLMLFDMQESYKAPEPEPSPEGAAACHIQEGCQTFSTAITVKGIHPLSRGVGFWNDYFDSNNQEMQNQFLEYARVIIEFLNQPCPLGCPVKKITYDRETITITPIDPNPQCDASPSPTPFNIRATGRNWIGSCRLALLDAFNQMQNQIENIPNSCGEGCTASVTVDDLDVSKCRRVAVGVEVDVSISGTQQCVGEPRDDEWLIELRREICIQCSNPNWPLPP